MTKLEMQALLMASEIESNIKSGVPVTTNLILALNEFRKVQAEAERSFGADLDNMYLQWLESEHSRVAETIQCPVVSIYELRRTKLKPV